MRKIEKTEKSNNDLLISAILIIVEKFISYIAYLFLVAAVVTLMVSLFFLYTSIFQNNPSLISQVSTASENLWHIDLPGTMKVVAFLGFVFMFFGEMGKLILRKKGRKINELLRKKIIISLIIIVAIHVPAIISVSFNNLVKANDKIFFYIFFTILMIGSVVSILFYFLLGWVAGKINNQKINF